MDILPPFLDTAAVQAQRRLAAGAVAVAAAGARPGFGALASTMARAASAAVFADALLGAVRAHINEAKTAAR
jgi:hypothetical protein